MARKKATTQIELQEQLHESAFGKNVAKISDEDDPMEILNDASAMLSVTDVVVPLDIVEFAERLVLDSNAVTLQECFAAAIDVSAYMTAVRNKCIVLGSKYVPKTIKSIGQKAGEGELDSAKFLFDFLGLRVKTPMAQVNTQVNIRTPLLKDIISVDEEGNIIGNV